MAQTQPAQPRWLTAAALVLLGLGWIHPLSAQGDEMTLDLAADREAYTSGDTIGVSVTAAYDDGSPVAAVRRARVEIRDGERRRLVRDALLDRGDGSFGYTYRILADDRPGTWQIGVTVEDLAHHRAGGTIFVAVTDAPAACPDLDGDGFEDASCGGEDCNDLDDSVHPGAVEMCGDGVDQDCSGSDPPCSGNPHDGLEWTGPATCLECHTEQAGEVHGSVMYQWKGETPYMANGTPPQGKIAGAVNSYCINILGNWGACGSCHVGLGARPEPEATREQLENIDCMLCHQRAYRRKKVDGAFVPDDAAMTITMDEAVRTVHLPERVNCLQCHARAGGGDAVKRGDLSLAHGDTADSVFDVHMATTGANLRCQSCHAFNDHRVAGKGSDLRPTDSPVEVACTNCHADMTDPDGHEGSDVDRHLARVACQTCHIPVYAKDASDSAASEATETHRTWLAPHGETPPIHPTMYEANDLVPEYRFWNRYSDNYLLGDIAAIDPNTGRYPTSRPLGGVDDPDSRLYPFKYKTALQPITNTTSQLIALDTSVYFATGDAAAATEQGLVNMGLPAHEPYSWVETDTFQLLNHEVSPSSQALGCNDCHGSTARIDLQGELGYGLKDSRDIVCRQCHGRKESKPFTEIHYKHVKDKRYDCSWCHSFSRPERGLRMP